MSSLNRRASHACEHLLRYPIPKSLSSGKGLTIAIKWLKSLVNEFSEFRSDDEFLVVALLYAADDLCIYAEAL